MMCSMYCRPTQGVGAADWHGVARIVCCGTGAFSDCCFVASSVLHQRHDVLGHLKIQHGWVARATPTMLRQTSVPGHPARSSAQWVHTRYCMHNNSFILSCDFGMSQTIFSVKRGYCQSPLPNSIRRPYSHPTLRSCTPLTPAYNSFWAQLMDS